METSARFYDWAWRSPKRPMSASGTKRAGNLPILIAPSKSTSLRRGSTGSISTTTSGCTARESCAKSSRTTRSTSRKHAKRSFVGRANGGVPERAPHWGELKKFFEQVGVDVEVDEIREVRELRHFLTHRRGELRTEKLRKQYAAEAGLLGPINVELSEASVLRSMDILGAAVRRIDGVVYQHAWGGASLGET